MSHWRLLSQSLPPLSSDAFMWQPEADGAGPFVWMVFVDHRGMVHFSLPHEQWLDYTKKENEEYMGELLKKCTHWAPIWDVISVPSFEIQP